MKYLLLSVTFVALSACLATHTAITKRDLDVKTRMSETIFLDPMAKDKQRVFVNIRNTSANKALDIEQDIIKGLHAKGFTIVDDPDDAFYFLQANVLRAGEVEKETLEKSFADAIIPGVLGGVIGNDKNGATGAAIGAAAGAGIGFLGSAFVNDVTYSIITDIQIGQRVDKNFKSTKKNQYLIENGWKKYSTRVASYANKVNLDYEEAQPQLVEELVHSVVGVL